MTAEGSKRKGTPGSFQHLVRSARRHRGATANQAVTALKEGTDAFAAAKRGAFQTVVQGANLVAYYQRALEDCGGPHESVARAAIEGAKQLFDALADEQYGHASELTAAVDVVGRMHDVVARYCGDRLPQSRGEISQLAWTRVYHLGWMAKDESLKGSPASFPALKATVAAQDARLFEAEHEAGVLPAGSLDTPADALERTRTLLRDQRFGDLSLLPPEGQGAATHEPQFRMAARRVLEAVVTEASPALLRGNDDQKREAKQLVRSAELLIKSQLGRRGIAWTTTSDVTLSALKRANDAFLASSGDGFELLGRAEDLIALVDRSLGEPGAVSTEVAREAVRGAEQLFNRVAFHEHKYVSGLTAAADLIGRMHDVVAGHLTSAVGHDMLADLATKAMDHAHVLRHKLRTDVMAGWPSEFPAALATTTAQNARLHQVKLAHGPQADRPPPGDALENGAKLLAEVRSGGLNLSEPDTGAGSELARSLKRDAARRVLAALVSEVRPARTRGNPAEESTARQLIEQTVRELGGQLDRCGIAATTDLQKAAEEAVGHKLDW